MMLGNQLDALSFPLCVAVLCFVFRFGTESQGGAEG